MITMKKLYLLPLFLIINFAFGQKITIHGTVTDSTGIHLPSATVILLQRVDSSLVAFTTSDQQGVFELKRVERMPYYLKVTYVGYKTFTKEIDPASGSVSIDVGTISMVPARTTLDEVIVQDK